MAVGNKYLKGLLAFGKGAKGDKMIAYAAIALGVILIVYFLMKPNDKGAKGKGKKPAAKGAVPAKAAASGRGSTPKRAARSKSPASPKRDESPAPEGVKRSARLRSRTPKKK